MNRKQLIKGIGIAALTATLPKSVFSIPNKTKGITAKKAARIVHITDTHIQPENGAPDGLTRCLHHLQSLPDKPDFIFNGGDTIMDALEKDKTRVQLQWDLWHSVIKNECSIKIEHCIGNHDVWGLETAKAEPLYGKKYALEMMQLAKPYRSFDHAGWHFIVLDSTHINKDNKWYTAKLDEEQKEWLKNDLAATNANTPILIISHIPILSAAVTRFGGMMKDEKWSVPGSLMHTDSEELTALFYKHNNVKLCISGHLHLAESVDYNGVTYLCNGAVCGSWWKNNTFRETKAGYAIIDLFTDGSFKRQYITYG